MHDVLDLTRERGPTPQDQRHRFVGSYVWELPFLKNATGAKRALLGGWSLGSIVTLTSGTPGDAGRAGQSGAHRRRRPPQRRGGYESAGGQPRPDAVVQPRRLHAAGRFDLRQRRQGHPASPGPRAVGLLRGSRTSASARSTRAQLRIESFNFTNTPNFGSPNTAFGNRNFGIISGAFNPRNMQIGLKFIF